jgi:hypothetical protein
VLMYENRKIRPVETVPGMGEERNNGEWWRGWIQLWYIVRTLVNITMYSHTTIKKFSLALKTVFLFWYLTLYLYFYNLL